MNKNNKRKSAVAAMALTLLVGAGSLAYFTDVKTGNMEAKSGIVQLGGDLGAVKADLMVPGDTKAMDGVLGDVKYEGNVKAKIRLNLSEVKGLEEATAEQGFVLVNAEGKAVDITAPIEMVAEGAGGIEALKGYQIKLLEKSDNTFQDKTVTGKVTVEAMQHDHTGTGWEKVADGTVNIVAK